MISTGSHCIDHPASGQPAVYGGSQAPAGRSAGAPPLACMKQIRRLWVINCSIAHFNSSDSGAGPAWLKNRSFKGAQR